MYQIANESYEHRPLLIIDFRVLCHKVYNLANSQTWLTEPDRIKYIKACWAFLLNAGPDFVDCTQASIIVVDDCKAILHHEDPCFKPGGIYWRNRVLPGYKGQRPPKSDDFYSAANLGLKYVTNTRAPWGYFSLEEWEADDFAGAVVAHKRLAQAMVEKEYNPELEFIANRPIVLWTVDTDWLQLAGNGVWWANTGPWTPLLRGVKETVAYAKKSQTLAKSTIKHPEEIVGIKVKYGDKADNIPPGSPRFLIDLINVPAKYNLRNQAIWPSVLSAITKDKPCMSEKHYNKAKSFIQSKGLAFPV